MASARFVEKANKIANDLVTELAEWFETQDAKFQAERLDEVTVVDYSFDFDESGYGYVNIRVHSGETF